MADNFITTKYGKVVTLEEARKTIVLKIHVKHGPGEVTTGVVIRAEAMYFASANIAPQLKEIAEHDPRNLIVEENELEYALSFFVYSEVKMQFADPHEVERLIDLIGCDWRNN